MAEKQIYGLQLLTFLVNKYDYQIVNIKGLSTQDYWLVNLKNPYSLICITQDAYTRDNIMGSSFGAVYRALLTTFTKSPQCLILNTHPTSENFSLEKITQMRILENQVDPSLIQIFPGIESVVRTVNNVAAEQRKLGKVIQQKMRSEFISQMKKEGTYPKMTMIIAGICIAMFVLQFLVTLMVKDSITSAIICGAYYKMNVVGAYEYWRLLTAGFVHVDLWHIMMNMFAFFSLGMTLEKKMGRKHYLITLLVSIVVGNLFVLVGDHNIVSLGLSGGLFGLLGVYTVMLFSEGYYRNPRILSNFLTMMMMNFLISMMPGISFLGHAGGFVCGLALGVYYSESKKLESLKKHALLALGSIVIGCLISSQLIIRVMPVYGGTDARIVKSVKQFHLNAYGDYLLDRYDAQLERQGEEGYKEYLTLIMGGGADYEEK